MIPDSTAKWAEDVKERVKLALYIKQKGAEEVDRADVQLRLRRLRDHYRIKTKKKKKQSTNLHPPVEETLEKRLKKEAGFSAGCQVFVINRICEKFCSA